MEDRRTKRLQLGNVKKKRGFNDRFVEVWEDKWKELEEILIRISWIDEANNVSNPDNIQGLGNAIETIQKIRECLVGYNEKRLPLSNVFRPEWKAPIENVKTYIIQNKWKPFQGQSNSREFIDRLIMDAFTYLDANARPDLSKIKERNHHISYMFDLVNNCVRDGFGPYLRQYLTGKICVEFDIIKPFDTSTAKYTNEKDYFRQTVRNALKSLEE